MRVQLLLFAGLVSLAACTQPADVAPDQDIKTLHARFHGGYKPLSCISSEALDVNLDGKALTDRFEEIKQVKDAEAEIGIYGKSHHNGSPSFIFSLTWPEQETARPEPTGYDPGIRPYYTPKVVYWKFVFNDALTQLLVKPIQLTPDLLDPDLYSSPDAVTVKDNNRIEVTLTKRLYTADGWKTVQIITLYERYTMTT